MSTYSTVDNELIELLRSLVRIQSWVGADEEKRKLHNENKLVEFLAAWLSENTNLEVIKQPLPGGRFNLIARKGRPDLVFLAHTDTVEPHEGSPFGMFSGQIDDGKIWGRGAADMKSGIAAMLQAIKLTPNVDNFWLILYADEEYDFLGMKHFVSEYGEIRPKLIVSSDGSNLRFGNGCRGCLELRMRVHGETGHPARGSGKSAIWGAMQALNELNKTLGLYTHPVMGGTSFNVAHFIGGTMLSAKESLNDQGFLTYVGQAGNVVPDVCEFVVDIRPAVPELNLDRVIDNLLEVLDSYGLRGEVIRKTHDLGAWYTDPADLESYIAIAQEVTGKEAVFDNPGDSGYIDMQMLWDNVGRPPALMFGGGNGDTAHKPNEHIEIDSFIKERDFFLQVLKRHTMR